MPTLPNSFNDMDDPRGGNAPRHKFCDLMTISLLCALCGGETAVDMEHFGQMKEDFLREFLELPHGIPSHDTLGRVFSMLDATVFEECFTRPAHSLPVLLTGNLRREVIAINGKTSRGSHRRRKGQKNWNYWHCLRTSACFIDDPKSWVRLT